MSRSTHTRRLAAFFALVLGIVSTIGGSAANLPNYALGYRQESAGANKAAVAIDIPYATVGKTILRLNVYQPYAVKDVRPPYPAVVLIHGGAWRFFDHTLIEGYGRLLATHGFVAVAVDYRSSREASWPACLLDVKTAIRWLRTNAARYQVDPKRIGVLGDSAGGHLAAMIGLTDPEAGFEGEEEGYPGVSTSVKAVVAFYGVYDLSAFSPLALQKGPIPWLLGKDCGSNAELLRQASPVNYITPKSPPFLLVHGLNDRIVPPAQTTNMAISLSGADVYCDVIMVNNADHMLFKRKGSPDPPLTEIDRQVIAFLQRWVAGR